MKPTITVGTISVSGGVAAMLLSLFFYVGSVNESRSDDQVIADLITRVITLENICMRLQNGRTE